MRAGGGSDPEPRENLGSRGSGGSRSLVLSALLSSSSPPTGAQFHCKDPAGGSAPVKTVVAAEGPASCLPRNVLSERERRKRISVSCERLRALLPQFEGRREDMASVLEMSVLFLRFAGPAAPGGEQQAVVPPSEDVWWCRWQEDVLQLALARQSSTGALGPGKGAPVTMSVSPVGGVLRGCGCKPLRAPFVSAPSRQQDPPSCATTGVDRGKAPTAGAEVRGRPAAPPAPRERPPHRGGSPCLFLGGTEAEVWVVDTRLPPATWGSLLPDVAPSQAHKEPLMLDPCPAVTLWTMAAGDGIPAAWTCFPVPWSPGATGGETAFPLPGPSGLAPRTPGPNPSKVLRAPPAWPPCSRQPAVPLMSEEAESCLGQAGPLAEGTDQAVPPGTRWVSGWHVHHPALPVPEGSAPHSLTTRVCMPACDVEDGLSFPLTASPDWWLGSLEGRGSGALAQAPARSSPPDRTEPGFLADPEPGSQELPDGALEVWGWDVGCTSLALRDEGDGIFPDFLPY
ncbi:spermatogenesis- and oogenesis-specific basic helix-loop-helix-containing protein 1 [Phyllostomus discolor]|uniref:Spermatogenesis- and oogenesis-specific basic helix-loop-helix-containing protein 1 n=1 Tax=Phyllostomus discolor TaxID=89673 RepID=A0A7E6DAP2_9CHIR|nr:spermatogenesis- and oogenesis-specific basic helix-loop-helix-containing protein 1 [Phyllostomus discolor]